jgi:excisionase family DNA binding protein
MEKFYTKREITEMLKVHLNTVDSWIAKGWLKAHKIGGRIRIYESDLNEFLNRWN